MMIPTVGVVAFKDDSVLLVRHGETAGHITGKYGLPGGRTEEGETPLQAAKREFEEETGLSTTESGMVTFPDNIWHAVIPRKDGTTKEFSFEIFLCKYFQGEIRGTEETMPEWVRLDSVESYDLLPNIASIIKRAKEFKDL